VVKKPLFIGFGFPLGNDRRSISVWVSRAHRVFAESYVKLHYFAVVYLGST